MSLFDNIYVYTIRKLVQESVLKKSNPKCPKQETPIFKTWWFLVEEVPKSIVLVEEVLKSKVLVEEVPKSTQAWVKDFVKGRGMGQLCQFLGIGRPQKMFY